MFDLSAYLARIALPARVTADAAGLQRLQHAHRLAIAFENLDVALGRPIATDSAGVFAKLVTGKRGGFCFEHNRLFGDALLASGYAARPLLGQVLLSGTAPATVTPPGTHALTLVTIDGEEWIADAGFGGSYSPPMPLRNGEEASAPDGARFRLQADADGWVLHRDGDPGTTDGRGTGPGWQPQYRFTTAAVHEEQIAAGSSWAATNADSRFVRHRIVSVVLPRGFARLTDRHYRRQVGAEVSEGEITDPRVYRIRLSLMFGIDLTRDEVGGLGLF